jgi:hypothetical protein
MYSFGFREELIIVSLEFTIITFMVIAIRFEVELVFLFLMKLMMVLYCHFFWQPNHNYNRSPGSIYSSSL